MKNTKKIRRQQVRETVAEVSPWDLSGSAESIYQELLDTEKYYLEKYENVIDSGWGWEGSNDDPGQFVLTVTRLENDKEYNTRVKRLMKIKDQEKYIMEKEAKAEYEEYLRLKKKFEKQN